MVAAKEQGKGSKGKNSKPKRPHAPKIDRTLNLRSDGDNIEAFRDFVARKQPSDSNQEFNAVAVYYLKRLMNLEHIGVDQVYTCYVEVGRKANEHFYQSLINTKNRMGWLDVENGEIDIPHRGVLFVEHDLPRKKNEN